MAATLAQFRSQFPEFSSTDDAAIELVLNEAAHIHNIRILATLFCAAHLLVYNQGVASGVEPSTEVKSRKAGPISAEYLTQAEDGTSGAFFTSSSYGRRFLVLESRSARAGIGAMVVA